MRAASLRTVNPSTTDTVFGSRSIVPALPARATTSGDIWLLPFDRRDPHLDGVGDFLTRLRVVNIPLELRPRQQQLAGVGAHHLTLLADGPFHERRRQEAIVLRARFLLLQIGNRMVRDATALQRLGTDFNCANPTRSVMPDGVTRLSHASWETAGIVNGYDLMMRSGSF